MTQLLHIVQQVPRWGWVIAAIYLLAVIGLTIKSFRNEKDRIWTFFDVPMLFLLPAIMVGGATIQQLLRPFKPFI